MPDAHSPQIQPYLGQLPQLGQGVYVHATASVIGDVVLGADVSVWPGAVIRGDINHIRIGAGSNIQDLSMLHVNHKSPADPQGSPLVIGDYVTIGHTVILHGCSIGDESLIGMGSIVMDKAVVEPRVLLGAGSLVPQGAVLESGYLYLGRPAKRIRPLTASELAELLESAHSYIQLKNNYLSGV